MKRIGLTDPRYIEGKSPEKEEVIVHMSMDEWRTFELLMAAVNDELPNDFNEVPSYEIGYNLEKHFRAILLWVQLRFKVSRLQRMVDKLKEATDEVDK